MVRARSLVKLAALCACGPFLLPTPARAQTAPPQKSAPDPKAAPASKTAPAAGKTAAPAAPTAPAAPLIPIERRPYKIHAIITVAPDSRLDSSARDALVDDLKLLVRRFIGAPWDLDVDAKGEDPLAHAFLDDLQPADFEALRTKYDKVWVIRVGREGARPMIRGREFDSETRRVGTVHKRNAPVDADSPRALFQLCLDVFAPLAEIGKQDGKYYALTVRGGLLEPASEVGRVVRPGTFFEPLRIVTPRNKPPIILSIPLTYLQTEGVEGATARALIASIWSDPLSKRMSQPFRFVAIGTKPGDAPTRLQFKSKTDKTPGAGYMLTARRWPDGPVREIGTTDRDGRIALPAGFSDGLVIVRLIAGNVEPLVEFPLMPGETEATRSIEFAPLPETVALETQLDALRDSVLDLIALRARLESRLKARYDGEDWSGIEETLKEFHTLPVRELFAKRLEAIKEAALRQQVALKRAILTRTAQAQITDVDSLIGRYLDDESFAMYADALERYKNEAEARALAAARA
ncbi:MAG: hypothetical protein KGM43_07500, partial [Planctomycetota bacterium]|nr:hypothetical protein [Planctomycetota bacterium]